MTAPDGASLEPIGWTGKHRTLKKLVEAGAAVAVWSDEEDDVVWVVDSVRWWAENGSRVLTADHRPDDADPTDSAFFPSVWRGDAGRVVLFEEASGPGERSGPQSGS